MSGRQQTLSVGSRPIAKYRLLVSATREAWTWLARCGALASQRRVLAELTDWQLRDIGVFRAEADGEVGKWFWHP